VTFADERGSSRAYSMPGPRNSCKRGKSVPRDAVGDATRQEIEHLKRENHDLKQLVAHLSLEVHRFKKTAIPAFDGAAGA